MNKPLDQTRNSAANVMDSSALWQVQANLALRNALIISLLVHALIIFAVKFKMPDVKEIKMPPKAIEVVLVNSKSKSKPTKADTLAQANLDGGGNTDAKARAKSNLPSTKDSIEVIAQEESQAQQRVKELETQAKTLMTQLKSKKTITRTDEPKPDKKAQTDIAGALEASLKTSQLEAQLEAQIAKDYHAYQTRPKRKYLGANTQEYRFATYVEEFREKIEKIGTENFPEAAKQKKLYGQLQLTVGIKSDGSIESIEMNKSSGHRILDAAAERILQLSAPFKPFPPEIRKDTDVLHITRTWTFTRADQLISE